MPESELLITAAPGQNLDMEKRRVIQRFMPLLVAENVARIREYKSGTPLKRIDMWNCVGLRMDKSFAGQSKVKARFDFSNKLISQKYDLMDELGIDASDRIAVRDDAPETQEWLRQKLEHLKSRGDIYIETASVLVCSDCDYLQAVAETKVKGCSLCDGENFHSEKKNALFVNLPADRKSLFEGKIYLPKKTGRVASHMRNLPPRMMISKEREYGLFLDLIGLPNLVLDPKIGISLLPEMVAREYGFSEITQVQGLSTSPNNIPYVSLLTENFFSSYLLLPKIPITDMDQAKEMGIIFTAGYLPFVLMAASTDLTPSQVKAARDSYTQTFTKISNVLYVLQKGEVGEIQLNGEERQLVSDSITDFDNYNVKDGLDKLRHFFRIQGRKYAEKLKKEGLSLHQADLEFLTEVVNLIFK